MQDRDELYLDRRERVRRGYRFGARHAPSPVDRIPNPTSDEKYLANSPQSDVYRQALSIVLGTPEIERHLTYITAGTVVTILGGGLTDSMIKSRAFTMLTYSMVFFVSATLAGLLIGIMLGEGIIPKELMPVLVFGLVSLSILVFMVLFGSLLLWSTERSQ